MSLTQVKLVDMVFVLGECNRNSLLASQSKLKRRHPWMFSFIPQD